MGKEIQHEDGQESLAQNNERARKLAKQADDARRAREAEQANGNGK